MSLSQGLPPAWKAMLQSSNISKQEQKKNPQAVLDALKWFDTKVHERQDKFMTTGSLSGKKI